MSDFPAIRPTLNLNFARSKQLDPRVTFRRASTGTYVDSDGLIKTANIDQPRFDHDPVTGVCKGLLVEESRQNLVTYSEQFDDAAWSKTNASISANFVTAPDGSMSGDKLVESVGTVQPAAFVSVSVTSGASYSFSVYCKAAERSTIQFYFTAGNPTGNPYINFDLYNSNVTVGGTGATGLITSVGNGWYRCSATYTATSTASQTIIILLTNTFSAARASTYTGNGISGVYLWGAQLEAGSSPTSYIPTTASTVTRSADLASITGTNFSSWYNQSEGTVFADLAIGVVSGHGFAISDGTVSNRIILDAQSTSKRFIVTNAGTSQAIISKTYTITSRTKSAAAYSTNNFQFCDQGSLGIFDNAGSVPVLLSRLYIGASATGTTLLANGAISRIAYWPKRLPDAQLQALTRP